jgi:gliding motility-associated protein GldM
MAGGKQTPRQKMINLMYLVFISMLALNMSKEVLSAFGRMNTSMEENTAATALRSDKLVTDLATKASESPEKYDILKKKADVVSSLTKDFNNFMNEMKSEMEASVEDATDYQTMDNADYLDNALFAGEGLTKKGTAFKKHIDDYRDGVLAILNDTAGMEAAANDVKKRFNTDEVENRDGQKVSYMDYNFKGFPLIASITNVTKLQSDAKNTEAEILAALLAGELSAQVSMSNYATIMTSPKSAYYQGETFDGELVLGRTDASTKPNAVELTLDGRKLSDKDYELDGGKVKLKVSAGSPGDHKLEGRLIFIQDGDSLEVPVNNTFATISKPNAAVISADKMNVVYRGVTNPMTISIPGIPNNKVSASGAGLKSAGGSKYLMNPGTGREVTITARGTLPDGQGISTSSKFRIKDIPRPTGTVRGEDGTLKMSRNNLSIATVGAKLFDFDFDLNLRVSEFSFKVPGQPTIKVRGSKLDSKAKAVLKRAKRGSTVQIYDIKASIQGNSSYRLKKISAVLVELTN